MSEPPGGDAVIPNEVTAAAEEMGQPVEFFHGIWKAAIARGLDPAETLRGILSLSRPAGS